MNLDLTEVMSVSQANPTPGAPKKTDDKSFFDVSIIYIYTYKNIIIYIYLLFTSPFPNQIRFEYYLLKN